MPSPPCRTQPDKQLVDERVALDAAVIAGVLPITSFSVVNLVAGASRLRLRNFLVSNFAAPRCSELKSVARFSSGQIYARQTLQMRIFSYSALRRVGMTGAVLTRAPFTGADMRGCVGCPTARRGNKAKRAGESR